ncbi:MAG: ECF transporter S component [Clostridia bacterium]|nr:ECF transporter S component [Clostridia bacterium]
MTTSEKRKTQIQSITIGAVLTALVIILQLTGSFIRFGVFSVSLVLVPIVIGAATCGVGVATWLGLVFGATVLLSGDAAPFMSINIFGTVLTVLAKGMLCGLVSGLVYKAFKRKTYLAVMTSAFICPVVNTGVFLLGCAVFFLDGIAPWGVDAGYNNVVAYMFLGLAGGNFIFELITNLILGPAIVTLLKTFKRQ